MEVTNINQVQSQAPTSNNNQTGVSAPQTDSQRADVSATRVVAQAETAQLEDRAKSSDETRFAQIKSRAAKYIDGANAFLADIKFTVYGQQANAAGTNEYVIRFTDLSTGKVNVVSEAQLLQDAGSGQIVSGQA